MKKFNYYLTLRREHKSCSFVLLLAVAMTVNAMLLASCANEENSFYKPAGRQIVTLEVTTDEWGDRQDAEAGTRASYGTLTENAGNKILPMTFQSGDAIGFYACDKTGKVVIANQKFTYNGSTWSTDDPIEYVTGLGSYTFFAYYPWVASLTGAPAVNSTPDITSAEAFFATAITAWTPTADQGDVTKFTASDLMVAKGSNTMPLFHEVNVTFAMTHQMGLLVTKPDITFYNMEDPTTTWTATQTFTTNIPYNNNGTYYYLCKPGVKTTVGGQSATLEKGQLIQMFFTNNEPSTMTVTGDKTLFALGSIQLEGAVSYQYSLSTDGGTTFGSYTSSKPSWLTHETVIKDGKITEIGATVTNSTSTTVNKGTGNIRDVAADATLKAAAPVTNVDLSMVDNAGAARASRTTANCYLVHAPGTYKIPLVYGNAIKNGDETSTTAFYTSQTSNTLQQLRNHTNAAITTPWIKTQLGECPDGAQLVWEDVRGMISSVGIDTSGNGFLTFTVDADNIAEGNAVIAATLSGTIVWSWHVWVTTQTLSDLTSIDTGEHTNLSGALAPYRVAPVNVGQVNGTVRANATIYAGDLCQVRATANGITVEFQVTAKDYASGGKTYYYPSPYYQWGRKDPMYPSTGAFNAAGTFVSTYSGTTLISDGSAASPGATIQHPDYWYYNTTNYDPYGTGSDYAGKYNYWDMNNTSTNNVTTATVKTIYDPCPPDFCVPTGNLYNYANSNSGQTAWQSIPPGRNWTINSTQIFLPAAGYRLYNNARVGNENSYGYLWSTSLYKASTGRILSFAVNHLVFTHSEKSTGASVRPVAEE